MRRLVLLLLVLLFTQAQAQMMPMGGMGGMGGGMGGMGGGMMNRGMMQPQGPPPGAPPGAPGAPGQTRSLESFYATPQNVKAVQAKVEQLVTPGDTSFGLLIVDFSVAPDGYAVGSKVVASYNQQVATRLIPLFDQLRFLVLKGPDGTAPPMSDCRVALCYPAPLADEPDPDPETFIAYDIEGQPLNQAEVRKLMGYPLYLRQRGIHGRITVKVLCDGNGFYRDHRVLVSPDPALTALLEDHVYRLRFQPPFRNRRPAKGWVVVHFDFGT